MDMAGLDLAELLPENLAEDVSVRAAADAVGEQIRAVAADARAALPWLANLDNLPSRVVDLLAWQYHVDFYDSTAPLADRRARVASAILDHRLHGTVAGVKAVLDRHIGAGNYTVEEWFASEPPLNPYLWRIKIHEAFNHDVFEAACAELTVAANVRSLLVGYIRWSELDALGLTWDQLDQYLFWETI